MGGGGLAEGVAPAVYGILDGDDVLGKVVEDANGEEDKLGYEPEMEIREAAQVEGDHPLREDEGGADEDEGEVSGDGGFLCSCFLRVRHVDGPREYAVAMGLGADKVVAFCRHHDGHYLWYQLNNFADLKY